jgi:hypothetical protein
MKWDRVDSAPRVKDQFALRIGVERACGASPSRTDEPRGDHGRDLQGDTLGAGRFLAASRVGSS